MENNNKDINLSNKKFLETYTNYSLVLRVLLLNFTGIKRFVEQWIDPEILFQNKSFDRITVQKGGYN